MSQNENIFRDALNKIMPTTAVELEAKIQDFADEAGLEIANPSRYSAFWVFARSAIVKPIMYLIDFLLDQICPQLYVATATGAGLDKLAQAHNLERKKSQKMRGLITFSRPGSSGVLAIPGGSVVRTIELKGMVYRIFTIDDTEIIDGETTVEVLSEAERGGSPYNFGRGYYSVLDSDLPGVSSVTNNANYIEKLGVDEEADEALRLRIRNIFTAAGEWHTDAKYISLISTFLGIDPNRVHITHDQPRGAGSADAYIVFDSGGTPAGLIEEVNQYINTYGNHGHGDDFLVKTLPEQSADVVLYLTMSSIIDMQKQATSMQKVQDIIRCAFRENQLYDNEVTKVQPFSTFSFSRLTQELHNLVPEISTLNFVNSDIQVTRAILRIGTLSMNPPVEEQL